MVIYSSSFVIQDILSRLTNTLTMFYYECMNDWVTC